MPLKHSVNRLGFRGASQLRENGVMSKPKPNQFPPEVWEQALRMALEHHDKYQALWTAVEAITNRRVLALNLRLDRKKS